MKKERLAWLGALALILPLAHGISGKTVNAGYNDDGTVTINSQNFPDGVFRKYVKDHIDRDGNGVLSVAEMDAVRELYVNQWSLDDENAFITSVKGVEYFPQLTVFWCDDNTIREVDVSKNTKLKELSCSGMELESLNVSGCTELEKLCCGMNSALTELDLSSCTKLKELDSMLCGIIELDLSKNTQLETLDCSISLVSKLELPNHPNLKQLECYSAKLKSVDVSNCPNLEMLDCSSNNLTEIDISKNPKLKKIITLGNNLSELDVSHNPNLEYIEVSGNPIRSLDVTNCKSLTALAFDNTSITEIDLSNAKKLVELSFSMCEISELELGDMHDLEYINCCQTKISKLDVSKMPKLEYLHSSDNGLTSLDVSKNPNLLVLDISFTNVTSIDLRNNKKLQALRASCGKLSSLDVSNCAQLEELSCQETFLSSLDVSQCTQLKELSCSSNSLIELDLSKNKTLVSLDCRGGNLKYLKLGNKPFLEALYVDDNELHDLDLSKCDQLCVVTCTSNQISQLDITKLTHIQGLIKQYGLIYEDGHYQCLVEDPEHYYLNYCGIAFDVNTTLIPDFPKPEPGKPTPTPTPNPGEPDPGENTGIAGFVERLYTVALGRASDPNGKQYWVDEIKNGKRTGADCARYFLMGTEFENMNMSDDKFVDVLYKTFFDRIGEDAGVKYWVTQLKSNVIGRRDVINCFIDSTEWCNVCADYGVKSGAPNAKAERPSAHAMEFATRLYTCCLGREPEDGGLKYWSLALTNLEQTGASAAKEFFTSKEFRNLNLQNDEYVRRLYTTFMGRDPEASEINYWVGEIKNGTRTKDSVMAFFGSSEEFTNICRQYGIDRGTI